MQWHDLTGNQQTEVINQYLRDKEAKTSPENVNRARELLSDDDNADTLLGILREIGYNDLGNVLDNPDGSEVDKEKGDGSVPHVKISVEIGDG